MLKHLFRLIDSWERIATRTPDMESKIRAKVYKKCAEDLFEIVNRELEICGTGSIIKVINHSFVNKERVEIIEGIDR